MLITKWITYFIWRSLKKLTTDIDLPKTTEICWKQDPLYYNINLTGDLPPSSLEGSPRAGSSSLHPGFFCKIKIQNPDTGLEVFDAECPWPQPNNSGGITMTNELHKAVADGINENGDVTCRKIPIGQSRNTSHWKTDVWRVDRNRNDEDEISPAPALLPTFMDMPFHWSYYALET